MRLLSLYFFTVSIVLMPFICNSSFAQNIPDSLVNKLNQASNDSMKARTLLAIGKAIEETTPEKSLGFYRQALILSGHIKNNRLVLSPYNDVGVCYIELNKLDSAIIAFEQAIPIARLLNDTLRVARVLANIGNVCLHKKDRVRAIEYYLQAAGLLENCGDRNRLPALYSNINSLLDDQGEYNKAREYGNKAITLAQEIGDNSSVVNAQLNLANTYGYLEQAEKKYELLEKAVPLAKKNQDLDQIATVYDNLGDYFFGEKKYVSSLANYLESYKYVLKMGNKYHLCTSYSLLAQTYHMLNQNN